MICTTRRACTTILRKSRNQRCNNNNNIIVNISNSAAIATKHRDDGILTMTMTTTTTPSVSNFHQPLLSSDLRETTGKQYSLQQQHQHVFTFFQQKQQQRSMVMITETKVSTPNQTQSTNSNDKNEEQMITVSTTTSSNDTNQTPLTITESCWKRIHQLAMKRNQSVDDLYLRIFVDAGGCSGFTYQFEFDTTPINIDDDIVFYETNVDHNSTDIANNSIAARVVVDTTSFTYINGATINYVQEMIKSTFEVQNNPQSESACGCGSSFALKNFAKNPALH